MTPIADGLTAAIVAGGASSRFGGTPKGLERVGGRRIVDRVIEAVRGVSTDLVLVSNADDAGNWVTGIRLVRDARPERGSLVGIHTALVNAPGAVLVVAWDMPFVVRPLLELLVQRSKDEPFATVPEVGNELQPFCAIYQQACFPIIESAIGRGELKVTRLLTRLPSLTRVSSAEIARLGDPTRLFFNVNTPADLEAAERMESPMSRSPDE